MTTPPETNATAWSAPILISLTNADHSAGGLNAEADEAVFPGPNYLLAEPAGPAS
jgi:hypothetical protein